MGDERNRRAYIEYDTAGKRPTTKRMWRQAHQPSPISVGVVIDGDQVLELTLYASGLWDLVRRQFGSRDATPIADGEIPPKTDYQVDVTRQVRYRHDDAGALGVGTIVQVAPGPLFTVRWTGGKVKGLMTDIREDELVNVEASDAT